MDRRWWLLCVGIAVCAIIIALVISIIAITRKTPPLILGDATSTSLTTTNNINVGKDLIVNGTSELADVAISGDASIEGDASVEGDTILTKSLSVDGDAHVGGNTSMSGRLIVGGRTTLEDNLTVEGNLIVDGTIQFNGPVSGAVSTTEVTTGHITLTDKTNQITLGTGNVTVLSSTAPSLVSKSTITIPDPNASTAELVMTNGLGTQTIVSGKRFGAITGGLPDLNSTAFGTAAGNITVATGTDNTAFGHRALASAAAIIRSTAVGSLALESSTDGSVNTGNNTAVGYQAGNALTTGDMNVAVGTQAMYRAVAISGSVAIGANAMDGSGTTMVNSVAVGSQSLRGVSGNSNVGVGRQAGQNVTGDNNTLIGATAGTSITSGTGNVIVGQGAGTGGMVAGADNVMLGRATTNTGAFSNSIALGAGAAITASNQLVIIGPVTVATVTAGALVPVNVSAYLPVKIGAVLYKLALYNP